MLTIPTGDLTGIVNDAIPFSYPKDDFPFLNCVRLEWDGGLLHALTTDQYTVGISSWHPDDDTFGVEVAEDDLFTDFGGADDPWTADITLDDAKAIVSTFKLGPKLGRVPLTVDYDHERGRVTVERTRESGHPALRMTVDIMPADTNVPDVRALLSKLDVAGKVQRLTFDPKKLAQFAKVRPVAPMELTFTGEDSAVLVAIGERFSGAVMPVKVADEKKAA